MNFSKIALKLANNFQKNAKNPIFLKKISQKKAKKCKKIFKKVPKTQKKSLHF